MDSLIEFLQEYPIFVGVLLSLIVLLSVLLFYLITKSKIVKLQQLCKKVLIRFVFCC